MELKGAPVANAITEACKKEIGALAAKGITPKLAVVRVGEREDDLSYERGIVKRFSSAGAKTEIFALPEDIGQDGLEEIIINLNSDDKIHGILIFRPLPKYISEARIKNLILPAKDIDCMTAENTAAVFEGNGNGYPPCTPKAVMEILNFYNIGLTGKKATVVGRSMVVGKPLAMMLASANATVTLCHTKTLDLAEECRNADIIAACAGKANMLGADCVRPGKTVIDVGINMVGDKLCGDVDYEAVKNIVEAISPVPGGVGAVTTSVLLKNTVQATSKNPVSRLCG